MNAIEKIQRRKKALKQELDLIKGHLDGSLKELQAYQPHEYLFRGLWELLRSGFLRSAGRVAREFLDPKSANGIFSSNGQDQQGNFWHGLIHRGVDLILEYISSQREEEKESS